MKNDYYVYFIVDPEKNQVFYVGKGRKNRAYSHLKGIKSSKRVQDKIKSIRSNGAEPIIIFHQKDLTEDIAYNLEKEMISYYGRKGIDDNGILMNICEDNRPPVRRFQSKSTREKISKNMKGKNKGKLPWNKGKSFKRGSQTKEQTIKVMRTRLVNLLLKIFEHYDVANDFTIGECKSKNIISKTSPISELSIIQYFGKMITYREDIPQLYSYEQQ
jgi:hypothetical protein